jgi:NAD(P)-dependent dehydrogenase (short-subunit alcohol dehydrogenase family)
MVKFLIIGIGSSIGTELATLLPSENIKVVGVGVSENVSIDSYLKCDLNSESNVHKCINRLVNEFGKFDSIIFCQRFRNRNFTNSASEISELRINALSIRYFLDQTELLLKPEGFRSIVAISSMVAEYPSIDTSLNYQASKSLLNSICKYYAVKLGPKGIRVNIISPYYFLKPSKKVNLKLKTKKSARLHRIPLRRECEVSELIPAIKFLAFPDSSYITGVVLPIDGGASLMVYQN